VVVATCNGARHLPDSLPGLGRDVQRLPAEAYEVLVIDNGSTDGTLEIAQSFADRLPGLRVIAEPERGLAFARNRGFAEARGELVAYIDDDAVATPGWLEAYVRLFDDEPDSMGAGGPIDVLWRTPQPEWWTPGLDEIFNRFERRPRRHRLRYPGVPIGTNMAFRRQVLVDLGGFDAAFGRKGDSLGAGEDSEFCLRLLRSGGTLVYEPEARVSHFAYAERLCPEFAHRRAAGHARARCRMDWRHLGARRVPHQLVRVMLACLRVLYRRRLRLEERLPFTYFKAYASELWRIIRNVESG
jgi:glycosyltransferase involved in cell wall biosynthesis